MIDRSTDNYVTVSRGLSSSDNSVTLPLKINPATGRLLVESSGGSGVAATDDAAFTFGTDSYTPAGGVYSSTLDSVNDGDGGAFAMTIKRALYISVLTPAGDSAMDDTNDALRVNVVASSASGGGTSMVDDAAFTPGTTEITPIGAMFDDVAPDSVNEGDGGVVRMSANRNLYSTIRDAAGNERGANVNASNELLVALSSVPSHPVTNAGTFAVQAACTNAGTFAVQVDGAALTALQLIDDTVFADDAAFTPTTSKVLAIGMMADETSPDSVDEGDIGIPRMTLDRRQRVANRSIEGPGEPTIDSYANIAINLTTGNDQVLVSSAANKQIWVYGYGFTVGDADGQTVSLQDEDNTAVTGIMEFARYGGIAVSPSGNFSMPVHKLATDKDLEVDITGGDVDGWLAYAIVSV